MVDAVTIRSRLRSNYSLQRTVSDKVRVVRARRAAAELGR